MTFKTSDLLIRFFFSTSAIGVGAVQANMAIFGAEQHREQRDTTEYFDKYYAAVNIGGFLASFIIAYVQQNIDWFIGHVVSTAMLGITFLLFLIGFRYYTHVKPHDSVITNFFPVLINAFQTWRNARRIIDERRSSSKLISLREQEDESDDLSHEMNANSISFFDYAKGVNDGRFQDRVVDDIKSLGRITVVFLLLIPYWIIYLQVK
jgi:peptide/histidine transporter 3/4